MEVKNFAIAIHGGAGTVSKSSMSKWKERAYKEVLRRAVTVGSIILQKGGRALDAVMEAVMIMEDSSLFNAGRGSVFTADGKHEMDAAIMNGRNLKAGSVAGVTDVKNPILLARMVMKKSKHVLLTGEGALNFAKEQDLELKPKEYFFDQSRYNQWLRAKEKNKVALDHDEASNNKFGTVGAVALDKKGNLAAATSTGGMVNKKYGRVGDSPIIGAGTYANNATCAVSCTGHGEYFLRYCVAHEVSSLIKYANKTLEDASELIINGVLKSAGGRGGLIAIDTLGNVAMPFNTSGMYRAYKISLEKEFISIY